MGRGVPLPPVKCATGTHRRFAPATRNPCFPKKATLAGFLRVLYSVSFFPREVAGSRDRSWEKQENGEKEREKGEKAGSETGPSSY